MSRSEERSYLEQGLVPAHEDGGPALKVIPDDLCTRCGVCDPICPKDVVRFDDRSFPYIETEGCIDCGLCLAVCPGIEFDYTKEYLERFAVDEPPLWLGGVYRSAWLCASTRPEVRRAGSGGGVVTGILAGLLEEGEIDAALSVGQDPDDPLRPAPVIARTTEEIVATAGSKYCVVPHAKVLRPVRRLEERFAFVGLGCQIEGLRKLEGINKRLRRKQIFTIGLACHGTLEREATLEVLQRKRVPLGQVVRFHYRGGSFPGKFQAVLSGGEVRDLHRFEYKDAAYNYLYRLYTPERCHTCPDFSAEFTDLSVTDFWVRGDDGRYLHPEGASLVLCRSERGERSLEALVRAGHLSGSPVSRDDVDRSFRHLHHDKRVAPFLRAEKAERRGRRAPRYNLPHPPATPRDRLTEWARSATLIFSHRSWTRRLMVAVFFSPVGDLVTWLNTNRKRLRWKRRARREKRRARRPA